jgi:hypothetical protein
MSFTNQVSILEPGKSQTRCFQYTTSNQNPKVTLYVIEAGNEKIEIFE